MDFILNYSTASLVDNVYKKIRQNVTYKALFFFNTYYQIKYLNIALFRGKRYIQIPRDNLCLVAGVLLQGWTQTHIQLVQMYSWCNLICSNRQR